MKEQAIRIQKVSAQRNGPRKKVRADEKLAAFLELELSIGSRFLESHEIFKTQRSQTYLNEVEDISPPLFIASSGRAKSKLIQRKQERNVRV